MCELGGNEPIPVGVLMLRKLDLASDRTVVNVLVLFCVAIASRILAFYVHKGRQYFTDRLQYVHPGGDSVLGRNSTAQNLVQPLLAARGEGWRSTRTPGVS